MTKDYFKRQIQFLHETCGVPYSVIGKKLNVTGQYISLMMNDRKPITERMLSRATESDFFINISCGGDENGCAKLETHNN